MDMENCLQVGVITSAHGIRGEVNVFPTTDDAGRFKKLKTVLTDNGTELTIESVKFFKQYVILKFKGIDDRNRAELYRKKPIYVTRENAVPLSEDEYFVADLIGMNVYTQEDVLVGIVTDVLSTGANDVYEITVDEDFEDKDVKVMPDKFYAPAIKECIKEVSLSNRRITIDIMPGLL